MNQALYARMNNKRKINKKIKIEEQSKSTKSLFLPNEVVNPGTVASICSPSYLGG
jgi:hypothetical protein